MFVVPRLRESGVHQRHVRRLHRFLALLRPARLRGRHLRARRGRLTGSLTGVGSGKIDPEVLMKSANDPSSPVKPRDSETSEGLDAGWESQGGGGWVPKLKALGGKRWVRLGAAAAAIFLLGLLIGTTLSGGEKTSAGSAAACPETKSGGGTAPAENEAAASAPVQAGAAAASTAPSPRTKSSASRSSSKTSRSERSDRGSTSGKGGHF